jgi:hypothetical protein
MMTVTRSVDDVLCEHVVFEVECIDRMFCNVYVPGLQYAAGLVGYVHRQLGLPIASTAPLARITEAFDKAVHRFARDHAIAWVDFAKGQRKDDIAQQYLARFSGTEAVLFVGRAQEKTKLFRTEKRRHANGDSYPWIVPATGLVNHFYFYCVDDDFGPFFLKFCSYFPYTAKLCINGNHWAQRQATKAGIGFTALDNGFAAVGDVDRLQRICDGLGPEQIEALLGKWLAVLPHPFSVADHAAGYRYELSILQAEFSLTQMLDKPVAGEGKALRTETTINDTTDFSIGKRLTNLPALREIGFSANRRLLHVQRLSHDPITGADALGAITGAITTATGTRIPGLRLAEQRTHALLQALLTFGCQANGFTNADLRALTTELRGLTPSTVTAGQTTYDLRRLKSRGLITRIPHTHRYTVTDHGLHTAHFLTCVHDRFLPTGLAHLADHTTAPPLQAASRAYNNALENLSHTTLLAA